MTLAVWSCSSCHFVLNWQVEAWPCNIAVYLPRVHFSSRVDRLGVSVWSSVSLFHWQCNSLRFACLTEWPVVLLQWYIGWQSRCICLSHQLHLGEGLHSVVSVVRRVFSCTWSSLLLWSCMMFSMMVVWLELLLVGGNLGASSYSKKFRTIIYYLWSDGPQHRWNTHTTKRCLRTSYCEWITKNEAIEGRCYSPKHSYWSWNSRELSPNRDEWKREIFCEEWCRRIYIWMATRDNQRYRRSPTPHDWTYQQHNSISVGHRFHE